MATTLGDVALVLGGKTLLRVRGNTTVADLLDQLDKACKGGRIIDADGYDVVAHQKVNLPAGEYAIELPTAGEPLISPLFTVQQVERILQLQAVIELVRPQLYVGLLFAPQNFASMHVPSQAMSAPCLESSFACQQVTGFWVWARFWVCCCI